MQVVSQLLIKLQIPLEPRSPILRLTLLPKIKTRKRKQKKKKKQLEHITSVVRCTNEIDISLDNLTQGETSSAHKQSLEEQIDQSSSDSSESRSATDGESSDYLSEDEGNQPIDESFSSVVYKKTQKLQTHLQKKVASRQAIANRSKGSKTH